ncbi:MAG: hypothetical protein KJZ87_18605 [Thermoguttaceae bacterium]|nr:hypothetical protein [Thermoguttaceae bacterium]
MLFRPSEVTKDAGKRDARRPEQAAWSSASSFISLAAAVVADHRSAVQTRGEGKTRHVDQRKPERRENAK